MSAMPLFTRQPEFISNDPRNDPNHDIGWTGEMQHDRYNAWLSSIDLSGLSVLDLGCAGAAVGAFCLDKGAKRYTGVEISSEICGMASANLTRHYAPDRWMILNTSAERYLDQAERHDIAVVAGIMHGVSDFLPFMRQVATAADTLIFESFHPNLTVIPSLLDRLIYLAPSEDERREIAKAMAWIEHEQPYIEINPDGKMCLDDSHGSATNVMKFGLSMGALKTIMHRLGFTADYGPYRTLCQTHPKYFGRGRRFAMLFRRSHDAVPMSFADLRESGMLVSRTWSMMGTDKIGA